MNFEKQAKARRNKIDLYERKYAKVFRNVILKQLNSFIEGVESNPIIAADSISIYFTEKPISDAYTAMIIDTGEAFRIRNFNRVVKAVSDGAWETIVSNYLELYSGFFITEVNNFTKSYVLERLQPILASAAREGLSIQQTSKLITLDIEEYKGKFARYRATRIARTEIIGTSNWASVQSVRAEGLQDDLLKKWQPELDGRERTTHRAMADSDPIAMNETFQVPRIKGGIDEMDFPGDKSGSSGNIINCRCTVVYVRVDETII